MPELLDNEFIVEQVYLASVTSPLHESYMFHFSKYLSLCVEP